MFSRSFSAANAQVVQVQERGTDLALVDLDFRGIKAIQEVHIQICQIPKHRAFSGRDEAETDRPFPPKHDRPWRPADAPPR